MSAILNAKPWRMVHSIAVCVPQARQTKSQATSRQARRLAAQPVNQRPIGVMQKKQIFGTKKQIKKNVAHLDHLIIWFVHAIFVLFWIYAIVMFSLRLLYGVFHDLEPGMLVALPMLWSSCHVVGFTPLCPTSFFGKAHLDLMRERFVLVDFS